MVFDKQSLSFEQAEEECMDIAQEMREAINIPSDQTYFRRMSREKANLFENWRK